MDNISAQLIGTRLLQHGFRDWFLYVFRVVNGSPFIIEKFHEQMFAEVANIISHKDTRVCMNVFPRSAKTTFAIYLCVYALLLNPKSQIIYTSFNTALLKQVAREIQRIMTHPAFLAMFPTLGTKSEEREDEPADPFWADFIQAETGKPVFTTTRIMTPQGGIIYLASIGSALTGFGAGSRTSNKFAGLLILDDPDQPTQVRSETIRNKTHTYLSETLLSRLNNPNTPIVCIQQRVHVDDMSAYLYEKYHFKPFIFALLDEMGSCVCPSQYTPERIKELQVENYVWQAQYMQNPIYLSGNVIKREWFKYYKDPENTRYRRIFITADTACKVNKWNDYTAIQVWGVTGNNRLRLLDMVHAKLEIQELQNTFMVVWDKWKDGIHGCRCTAIHIEDKASGIQVIQQLRRIGGLPILSYTPDSDKLARVMAAVPQIVAGNVELPESELHPLSAELLRETDAFAADGSALHDDMVDAMTMAIDAAFNTRGYF